MEREAVLMMFCASTGVTQAKVSSAVIIVFLFIIDSWLFFVLINDNNRY